jgi:hypothetical protein
MAYNHAYFRFQVQAWLDAGWLKPGHKLIEFGSQEFHSDLEETRREIATFLGKHGLAPTVIEGVLGTGFPQIHLIFGMLGIEYSSIDVDGARGSAFFDLNTFATPPEWQGVFDFVNDEGTIEHLVNPINGFHVAHEMAKVGGIIRHSFPLIGWREHGFFYPTTKFCAHLAGDNAYEILRARVLLNEHTRFEDVFFKDVFDETWSPIAPPKVTNMWADLVYRKTSDRPFVIPVDHVDGPEAQKARRLLIGHYDRVAKSRIT